MKKTNKKLVIVSIALLVVLAVAGFVTFSILPKNNAKQEVEKIAIDSSLINTNGEVIDLNEEGDVVPHVKELIESDKEVVFLISTPACSEKTAQFKANVKKYLKDNNLSFYYFTSDYAKKTSISEKVKYYPSVIIMKDGEVERFLRFDSDEDKSSYESYDGFKEWFEKNAEF